MLRSECGMQGAERRAGRLVHAQLQHQPAVYRRRAYSPEGEGPRQMLYKVAHSKAKRKADGRAMYLTAGMKSG